MDSPFNRLSVGVELRTYGNRPVTPVETSGMPVVTQRREVAAWPTLDLSSVPTHNARPWSAVRISQTPSVRMNRGDPVGGNVLDVGAVVSGAGTSKTHAGAYRDCKERRELVLWWTFEAKPTSSKSRHASLHVVFCCYPAGRGRGILPV